MQPKVLIIGGETYLAYHTKNMLSQQAQFRMSYRFGRREPTCQWLHLGSFLSLDCIERGIMEILDSEMFDWIILSPEAFSFVTRKKVAFGLLGALTKTNFPGSVIMFSHDGVNDAAGASGFPNLALLYEIETRLFQIQSIDRAFILRIAMLQEQLFFWLPYVDSRGFNFPIPLELLNPIATRDVVAFVGCLLSGLAKGYAATRKRWIFDLTGDGSHTIYLNESIRINVDPNANICNMYKAEFGQLCDPVRNNYHTGLPLWLASDEASLLYEYMCYATWNTHPAQTTQEDWSTIVRGSRQKLSTVLKILCDYHP
ncbi:hypothetical protein BGZ94_003133 [Podila epigama]|nr:hypothetical protein BGZ94_003133 [Podila epigama]